MTTSHRRPLLKQFGRLRRVDFVRFPVWVACHTLDYDEPWYEETTEETFRPYNERLPFDPKQGIAVVSATFSLADNSTVSGFVTPLPKGGFKNSILSLPEIADQQPHVFVSGGRQLGFWWGMITPPEDVRSRAYTMLRRTAAQVFPMTFSAEPGIAVGLCSGRIDGFCYAPDLKNLECLR